MNADFFRCATGWVGPRARITSRDVICPEDVGDGFQMNSVAPGLRERDGAVAVAMDEGWRADTVRLAVPEPCFADGYAVVDNHARRSVVAVQFAVDVVFLATVTVLFAMDFQQGGSFGGIAMSLSVPPVLKLLRSITALEAKRRPVFAGAIEKKSMMVAERGWLAPITPLREYAI